VKLFDSIVNNNAGGNDIGGRAGGGIFNAGTMMLYDSDVSDNSAIFPSGLTGAGGGIFNSVDATLVLRSSTVTGNRSRSGGGISNGGSLSLYDTAISGNTGLGTAIGYEPAGEGGGILNSPDATVVLRSSTVTGNRTGLGGGISNGGSSSLYDTTITGNTALGALLGFDPPGVFGYEPPGGGIYDVGALNVFDSVISGNTPNDCTQVFASPPYSAECSL